MLKDLEQFKYHYFFFTHALLQFYIYELICTKSTHQRDSIYLLLIMAHSLKTTGILSLWCANSLDSKIFRRHLIWHIKINEL